jgi:hypothetical protein
MQTARSDARRSAFGALEKQKELAMPALRRDNLANQLIKKRA